MAYLAVVGAIAALMVATWALSVALRNVSIIDIVWGFGFVVVAWVSWAVADGYAPRRHLLTAMTTIWGLRLAGYLLWRNHGKGEDWRYAAMRKRRPTTFWVRSLVTVFALQGVLMWFVSLPVQIGQQPDDRGAFVVLAPIGVALWLVGMVFETVGDLQLARFKANPANAGKLLTTGLWRYTRHPNYFGDSAVWFGIWIVAASTVAGALTLLSPIVMTVLLLRVSGVPLLERSLQRRKPGYDDYIATTSSFLPRPPRKAGS
jgi:steroid 5-alpha reductase family enzyme